MSTTCPPPSSSTSASAPPAKTQSFFEQQRELLLREIAVSFEHVLANINKLNRNLEGVIAVGNEFSSVEALWSQFENVMAKDPDAEGDGEERHGEEEREEAETTMFEEGKNNNHGHTR